MKNKQKLWAHYEQLTTILGYYITLFFAVPILLLCFSCLAHSAEIDAKAQDAVKIVFLSGLKWYAIIMPIITILFIIWFIFYSDRVEFTDDSILYYRWLWSKKSYRTFYDEITECVFNDGLWRRKNDYVSGRKILLYHRNDVILRFDLYDKLCLVVLSTLNGKKIRLVDDSHALQSIDNYFKIDFMSLPQEQQLKLLKYYCKLTRPKYKTGEEILRKK
jgi:hypothetical protein